MKNQPRKSILPEEIKDHRIARPIWDGLIFLSAIFIVAFRVEVVGTLVFLGLIGLILILSDRLSDAFLPLILLTVFVTRLYNSYETFIQYIWYYVIIISGAVFHLIYYWKKPRIGYSFLGIVGVAIAVTLGGLFTIPTSEYFKPFTLYYVAGLGILMVLVYLIVQPRADQKARDRFIQGLFLSGALAVFAVGAFFVIRQLKLPESEKYYFTQSVNNLSTFLMISMPVGFLYSKRRKITILYQLLHFAALLLCGGRAGMFLGSLEFAFLLVFFSFYKADRFRRIVYLSILVIGIVIVFVLPREILTSLLLRGKRTSNSPASPISLFESAFGIFVSGGEARVGLLKRSFTDFLSNPVFGVGIGYSGNTDLYAPKTGAMNWYHMWGPQIWGSMGTVGILAYGFQLFRRIRLAFARRGFPEVTLSLCYFGLFLMTQVNPGEFCPIPYGVIATAIFVFLEPRTRAEAGRARFLVRGMKREKTEASAGVG